MHGKKTIYFIFIITAKFFLIMSFELLAAEPGRGRQAEERPHLEDVEVGAVGLFNNGAAVAGTIGTKEIKGRIVQNAVKEGIKQSKIIEKTANKTKEAVVKLSTNTSPQKLTMGLTMEQG